MSDIVIQVENLYKEYRLGTISHGTLRKDIQSWWARMRGKEDPNSIISSSQPFNSSTGSSTLQPSINNPHMLALNDVSFEVKRGEVLGIIGRNGAGKSTLLKILSEVTSPTKGTVKIKGRVSSLLEVGTGFHPELTGRENIYLNGAILGMTNKEIAEKFDEIVAFAEIEQFIDTPVKRYSSGMYVRLAFAVAAHLEPEILIVDEVLAVGDASFQKKCLGKMGEVSREGRTVLFVSHNMGAIENLCLRVVLLNNGNLMQDSGDVRAVITQYLNRGSEQKDLSSTWSNSGNEYPHSVMQPLFFAVEDQQGNPLTEPALNDKPLHIVIRAFIKQIDPSLSVGIALYSDTSELLLWSLTTDGQHNTWPQIDLGIVEFRCTLPQRFLNEGIYRVEMNSGLHCQDWFLKPTYNSPAVYFEIRGGLSDSPYWMWKRPGIIAPEWKWERTA